MRAAVCGAACQLHPHGRLGGNPDDRVLQHGRVARNSSIASADQDRHQAALLFIARVAETATVSQVTGDYVEDGRLHILQDKDIPYYATIFRIHGPFLFGATDKIGVVTEKMHALPPIVIMRLRNMTAVDASGLFALEGIAKQLHAAKRTLILCGAREQPAKMIHQAEFEEVVGRENICANVQEALRRAEEVFEQIEAGAAIKVT